MPRLGYTYNFLPIYLNPHQQLDSHERQMIEDQVNSKHKGKKRTIGDIFGCEEATYFCVDEDKWRVMNIQIFENLETMIEYNKTGYKDENGESTWNEDYSISYIYPNKRIYEAWINIPIHSNKVLKYFLQKNTEGETKINVIIYELF
tara:strand:+ start:190 stop:630 length:441 start_codon:yes stop_codon:yes gene_type:complete